MYIRIEDDYSSYYSPEPRESLIRYALCDGIEPPSYLINIIILDFYYIHYNINYKSFLEYKKFKFPIDQYSKLLIKKKNVLS